MSKPLVDLLNAALDQPWIHAGFDGRYSIVQSGETINIYFEQTSNIEGWELNFAFPAVPYKDERREVWFAHAGFVAIWRSIRDEVIAKVVALKPKRVIVAGYSQGAAITVLAFEDLQNKLGPIVDGYAFAAPRVLWLPSRRLRKRFGRLTIFRNRGDLVPMLPPWLMGYSHVGDVVRIGKPALPSPMHHLPGEYLTALGAI